MEFIADQYYGWLMREAPDNRWIPLLKVLFGYLLLLILGSLAVLIGLGKVEATSSYGLDIILGGLLTMAGAFSGWCFEKRDRQQDYPDPPSPPHE